MKRTVRETPRRLRGFYWVLKGRRLFRRPIRRIGFQSVIDPTVYRNLLQTKAAFYRADGKPLTRDQILAKHQ